MSALDLFASAMGAFILIAVIALPYYLKTDKGLFKENQDVKKELARLDADKNALQKQNKALDQDNQALKQKNQSLNQDKKKLQQQADDLKNKADGLDQKNKKLQQQADALKKELDNAVSFALLGIATRANSFTVVIDMSGSMDEYTDIMERTVKRLLEPLKNNNKVQIIGYNGKIGLVEWQTPYNTLAMTPSNSAAAMQFVQSLSSRFDGGTPTNKALEAALNYDTEAVILLTDGAPDSDGQWIIDNITRKNAGNKEIHTVALGEYHSSSKLVNFLQGLARRNKGAFVGVSN